MGKVTLLSGIVWDQIELHDGLRRTIKMSYAQPYHKFIDLRSYLPTISEFRIARFNNVRGVNFTPRQVAVSEAVWLKLIFCTFTRHSAYRKFRTSIEKTTLLRYFENIYHFKYCFYARSYRHSMISDKKSVGTILLACNINITRISSLFYSRVHTYCLKRTYFRSI